MGNVLCKIDAGDPSKAEKVEERVRHEQFPGVLGTSFSERVGNRRRLKGRRLESFSFETEASQERSIDDTSGTSGDNTTGESGDNTSGDSGSDGKDPGGRDGGSGNSPSSAEEEDILSVSSRISLSNFA